MITQILLGVVALGVSSLVFYLLTRQTPPTPVLPVEDDGYPTWKVVLACIIMGLLCLAFVVSAVVWIG